MQTFLKEPKWAGRVKHILLSLIMPDTWFYRLNIRLIISYLYMVDNNVGGEVTEVPGQGSDGGGHSVGLARWTHTLDVSAGTKKRKIHRSRDTGLGLVLPLKGSCPGQKYAARINI